MATLPDAIRSLLYMPDDEIRKMASGSRFCPDNVLNIVVSARRAVENRPWPVGEEDYRNGMLVCAATNLLTKLTNGC